MTVSDSGGRKSSKASRSLETPEIQGESGDGRLRTTSKVVGRLARRDGSAEPLSGAPEVRQVLTKGGLPVRHEAEAKGSDSRAQKSSKASKVSEAIENKGENESGRLRAASKSVLRLTKRTIDALPAVDGPTLHWDATLKGFGLKQFAGGAMTFIVNYRNRDGVQRRVSLGRFGAVTVEEARTRAQGLLGEVAAGGDPAKAVKDHRQAPTVSDLLDDYLSKHVEVANKPRTRALVRDLVKNHLRPALGSLKVASVTRQDVQKLRRDMGETPRAANLALAALSKAFGLAEEWGWRPEGSNPCKRVPRYEENERERFLSNEEIARLGAAVEEAETIGLPWRENEDAKAKHRPRDENRRAAVNPRALAAIKLLLLTGARRSEILELKWEHVDFKEGKIQLPTKKGGALKAAPVNTDALAILASLPKVKRSPWVLPAPEDEKKPLSPSVISHAWQRLRAHAGLADVRLHDLRHTFGTYASQTGANAFAIRDALRHKTTSMTNRYVNRDADPMRALAESIGERIAAGLSGGAGAEVVPFKRKTSP